jgi:protein transport protein SEC23
MCLVLISRLDLATKSWTCLFCACNNPFPAHYAGISDMQKPAELFAEYMTIEYTLMTSPQAPAIIFVLDLCIPEKELKALQDSVLQAISLLPPHFLIGLVTFGTCVEHILFYMFIFKS